MKKIEVATLAGGCFWCTEALFKRLRGVESVLPGYSGGTVENPSYEDVCEGTTGHAEAVQVTFDPEQIPFEKILDIFWHTHNPTTLNQQGHDVGTQYRSAIFYYDAHQKEVAEASKAAFEKEGLYKEKVVTEIKPFTQFYEAENYHKNYFDKHQESSYCGVIISPKIHTLLQKYGKDVKAEYASEAH